MLVTLLLAPGFQSSVIALATLWGHLQFKNKVFTITGKKLKIRKEGKKKIAAKFKES